MNFKDIENFLKNNYKIMIICALVYLLMSNKSEKFTVTEALDSMKSTQATVNSIASKVDQNYVDLKSKIRLSNRWTKYPDQGTDQAEISNDTGTYKKLMIVGNKSSKTRKVGIWDHLDVHGNQDVTNSFSAGKIESRGDVKGKRICIGATCIDENDLKKMKSSRMIGGWAGNGDGSTHMLEEGGWHELHGKAKYDLWANDKWDFAFIYRGWRFELAEDKNGGKPQKFENKKHNIMKCDIKRNKGSSYRLTWIGY